MKSQTSWYILLSSSYFVIVILNIIILHRNVFIIVIFCAIVKLIRKFGIVKALIQVHWKTEVI